MPPSEVNESEMNETKTERKWLQQNNNKRTFLIARQLGHANCEYRATRDQEALVENVDPDFRVGPLRALRPKRRRLAHAVHDRFQQLL